MLKKQFQEKTITPSEKVQEQNEGVFTFYISVQKLSKVETMNNKKKYLKNATVSISESRLC